MNGSEGQEMTYRQDGKPYDLFAKYHLKYVNVCS